MPPNRGDLWGIDKLARHLDEVRVHWNVGRVQGVLQGRAPVTKWLSDDTELVEIGEDSLVANMMKEGASHKVLTKGVFFRNSYYTPVDDNHRAGEDVYVRYLERNADFIAISPTREFNHFTFAIHEDCITTANRVKLMQTRAKQEEMARRIDADATSRRLHGQAVSTDSESTWSAVSDPADDWTPDRSPTSERDHPAAATEEPPSDLWADIASGSAVDEPTAPGADESESEPHLAAGDSEPADPGSGSVTVINTERSRTTPVHRRKAPLPPAPPRGEHPARIKARASRAADRVARRGLSTPGTPTPPQPEEK